MDVLQKCNWLSNAINWARIRTLILMRVIICIRVEVPGVKHLQDYDFAPVIEKAKAHRSGAMQRRHRCD